MQGICVGFPFRHLLSLGVFVFSSFCLRSFLYYGISRTMYRFQYYPWEHTFVFLCFFFFIWVLSLSLGSTIASYFVCAKKDYILNSAFYLFIAVFALHQTVDSTEDKSSFTSKSRTSAVYREYLHKPSNALLYWAMPACFVFFLGQTANRIAVCSQARSRCNEKGIRIP